MHSLILVMQVFLLYADFSGHISMSGGCSILYPYFMSRVNVMNIVPLLYFQGKGDVLTYWLVSDDKQRRLTRIESYYSEHQSPTHSGNNNITCDTDSTCSCQNPARVDPPSYDQAISQQHHTEVDIPTDSVPTGVISECSSENVSNIDSREYATCSQLLDSDMRNGKVSTSSKQDGRFDTQIEMAPLLSHPTL